eukprot:403363404
MRKVKTNFAKLNEISQQQQQMNQSTMSDLNSSRSTDSQAIDNRLKMNFTRYRCFNDIPIRERFTNNDKYMELKVKWQERTIKEKLLYEECLEIEPQTFFTGFMTQTYQLRHGPGIIIYPNGSKYEGEFIKDKQTGEGRFWTEFGDYYEGNFLNNQKHGQGLFVARYGLIYDGEFKNNVEHGRGIKIWPDGSCYMGEINEGRIHGFGRYIWNNEQVYTGDWKDNLMDGYGTYEWPDGRKHEGYYKMNNMNGQGKMYWPNGTIYEGNYEDDQKHGYGILISPNGIRYEGEWLNGLNNGQGKLVYPDGRVESGMWVAGRQVSRFSLTPQQPDQQQLDYNGLNQIPNSMYIQQDSQDQTNNNLIISQTSAYAQIQANKALQIETQQQIYREMLLQKQKQENTPSQENKTFDYSQANPGSQ